MEVRYTKYDVEMSSVKRLVSKVSLKVYSRFLDVPVFREFQTCTMIYLADFMI